MDFFVWQGARKPLSKLSNDEQRRQTEKGTILRDKISESMYY